MASLPGSGTEQDPWRIESLADFNEIDDYVSTPFVLNPRAGAFSAFAWIKGGEPDEVIISQTDGTGRGGRRWLCTDPLDGKLMTTLADIVQQLPLQSQFVVTDGIWHHIGVVWDGSRRYLYVDGDEAARDTDALVYGLGYSYGGLYFGAGKTLDAGNFWTGLIDDVRIYERALTADEIAALAD